MSATAIKKFNIDFQPDRSQKGPEISVLVALCLFAFLMLAALLMVKSYGGITPKVTNFFSEIRKQKSERFKLGDLTLGNSLSSLQAKRPNVMGGVTAKGLITASYLENGARYTAWFAKEGTKNYSFRARYDSIFTEVDEAAVIVELTDTHGAPSTSSCNARITDGMRACKYTWWLPKGQRLDVATRTPISGEQTLKVTMIVTDTHLQGRLLRKPKGISHY